MTEHLQLSPSELRFRFELRRNIPVTLSLHNPGSEPVAFKVKTTSPKKYCVRPSSGIVDPGATKDVQARLPGQQLWVSAKVDALDRAVKSSLLQVIMQAQREYPPSLADCKDKFLVQTCTVSSDVKEASPDIFETGIGDIKHTKLRVVLLGPQKPPSPVPEGIEEDAPSPGKDKPFQSAQETAGPRPLVGYDTGTSVHSLASTAAEQHMHKQGSSQVAAMRAAQPHSRPAQPGL